MIDNALANFNKTAPLTVLAMLAFAANSILCRLALGQDLIDPATFSTVRIASGAAILLPFMVRGGRSDGKNPASWRSAAALFFYVALFSFAYRSISAGTGALILFGATQITMFVAALRAGEQFSPLSWIGFALAILGLVYLALPSVAAPDPVGALLMSGAGLSWGLYTLLGKGAGDPLGNTARNFAYAVLPAAILGLAFSHGASVTPRGLALAAASGSITSGIGYVIWYAALHRLSVTHAATVQLAVPILAAFGGALLLGEHITARLLTASAITLCGVFVVVRQRVKA